MNDKLRRFLALYLLHSLQGMTFGDWWSLLRRNRFAVDPRYWPRAAFQTASSLSTSVNARLERRKHGDRVNATRVLPPVFILGHWRSGTTHLHNLLTLDPQFACPNILQAMHPHTFLSTESKMTPLAERMMVRRRPQDDVALGVDSPTEDEFALGSMTALSPYMEWSFPRDDHDYLKYLTFRDASPDEIARWKAALTEFLKKLTLKYERPLVLKSPPHTARVRLLLEAFPDARFVHIHRNPYTVFRSTKHLFGAVSPYFRFQRAGVRYDTEDRIIDTYTEMYDAFFGERHLVPQDRFCEVGYEELERRPVEVTRSIYESLGIEGFEGVRPRVETYLGTIADYRKNRHAELPEAVRARIAREWRRSFEEWGYEA